jgi:hypothetical protein
MAKLLDEDLCPMFCIKTPDFSDRVMFLLSSRRRKLKFLLHLETEMTHLAVVSSIIYYLRANFLRIQIRETRLSMGLSCHKNPFMSARLMDCMLLKSGSKSARHQSLRFKLPFVFGIFELHCKHQSFG